MLTRSLGKIVPKRTQSLDSRWSLLAFPLEVFTNIPGCVFYLESEKKKIKQTFLAITLTQASWRAMSACLDLAAARSSQREGKKILNHVNARRRAKGQKSHRHHLLPPPPRSAERHTNAFPSWSLQREDK